jgi:hypothetical protein
MPKPKYLNELKEYYMNKKELNEDHEVWMGGRYSSHAHLSSSLFHS